MLKVIASFFSRMHKRLYKEKNPCIGHSRKLSTLTMTGNAEDRRLEKKSGMVSPYSQRTTGKTQVQEWWELLQPMAF